MHLFAAQSISRIGATPREKPHRGIFGWQAGNMPDQRRRKSLARSGKSGYDATKNASGIACWPNRDPASENGGTNLYAFVSNSATNFLDYNGLWTISRSGGERANAYPDFPLEPIAFLAAKIGLNPSESHLWLKDKDGNPVAINDPINKCTYTIPNKIIVAVGGDVDTYFSLVWYILTQRAHELRDHAVSKGYTVVYENWHTVPFNKNTIISNISNIHGISLFGHGLVNNVLPPYNSPGNGSFSIRLMQPDSEDISPQEVAPYGLAFVMAKFCSSGVGGWANIVSPYGWGHVTAGPFTLPFIMSWHMNNAKNSLTNQSQ